MKTDEINKSNRYTEDKILPKAYLRSKSYPKPWAIILFHYNDAFCRLPKADRRLGVTGEEDVVTNKNAACCFFIRKTPLHPCGVSLVRFFPLVERNEHINPLSLMTRQVSENTLFIFKQKKNGSVDPFLL